MEVCRSSMDGGMIVENGNKMYTERERDEGISLRQSRDRI